MAKLTFILEDGQKVAVSLTDSITIGRSEGNGVVVDDDRISPFHAEILMSADGRIQVRECDAGAGTFVNEERIQSYPLRHGDRLAFGPLIALFDAEEEPLPLAVKPSSAEKMALEAEISAQEKRLTELQSKNELVEGKIAEMTATSQALAAELEVKITALKQLDSAKESATQAVSDLMTKQEGEALRIQQLCEEAELAEQKITELKQQVTTLDANKHLLETQASILPGKIDSLNAEIQQREQRSTQIQTEIQVAEAQLAETQTRCKETEDRSSALTSTLTALDEEYSSLKDLMEELEEKLVAQRTLLAEGTQRTELLQERCHQLEAQCDVLLAKKQRLSETEEKQSVMRESKEPSETEPLVGSPTPSFTTNRIVPRVVSSEITTPRPRGIPMKSERITRKGVPVPKGAGGSSS